METQSPSSEKATSKLSALERLKAEKTEIIGPIILGEKSPDQMTFAEFWEPNGLLYHGASQEFEYSSRGEYDPEEAGVKGSTDYGAGLYTTDNLPQAENYSLVRQRDPECEPIVYGFRPHKAQMLDVRKKENPLQNGALPKWFVEIWLEYAQEYIKTRDWLPKMAPEIKKRLMTNFKKEFIDRVKQALEDGQPIFIRNQIRKNKTEQGIFYFDDNGLIDNIFKDFMLSLGFDGMIYLEAGEGESRALLTGYVFYNPEIIDTYAGWINRP